MRIAALYARVSGEQQRDSHTIASQTEALIAYAERHGYRVTPDMIIENDGYGGVVFERPGLERVRDLATEGRIDTVVVHAPDRLSRRYAYQVVIIEELARQGVATVFVNAPSMETPEDHLLVQFQGMIAEYERAQILERSRRGKCHRARQGEVAVLGGAPYGYRCYTCDHMSIGAITRSLKEREVPTAPVRAGNARPCGRYSATPPTRDSLFRQDPSDAAEKRDTSCTLARKLYQRHHWRSRETA